jgi:hypothetical protein
LTPNPFRLVHRAAASEEVALEERLGWYDPFRQERAIDHFDAAVPPVMVS